MQTSMSVLFFNGRLESHDIIPHTEILIRKSDLIELKALFIFKNSLRDPKIEHSNNPDSVNFFFI